MKNKIIKSVAIACACVCVCLAVVLGLVFGLGSDKVSSIELDENELILVENEFAYLTATVDGKATVTWASSQSDKVKVNKNGRVMAIAETEAPVTITAKAGNKTATCTVIVTSKEDITYAPVASVSFKVDDLSSEYFEHDHKAENCTNTYSFNEETQLDEDGVIFITANKANKNGQKTPNLSERATSGWDGYFYSIKTQGTGSINNGSFKIALTQAAQITVVCRNTSNGYPTMNVGLFDYKYSQLGESQQVLKSENRNLTYLTFETVQAGDFYIGTLGGSLDVYAISINYAE